MSGITYRRTGQSLGLLIMSKLRVLQESGDIRDIVVNQAQQYQRPCVAYWCESSVTQADKSAERETVAVTLQAYGTDYAGTTLLAEKVRGLFEGRTMELQLADGILAVDRVELADFADIFEGDSYGKAMKFAMRLVRPINRE